jgi:hypothetical protein
MDHSELYRRMGVHCSHKTIKQEKAVKPELRKKLKAGGETFQAKMVNRVFGLKPKLNPSQPKQTVSALSKGGHCEK